MRFPLLLFFAREGGNEDTIPGWGGGTDEKSDVAARVLFVYYGETRPPPAPLGKGGDMSSTCSDDAVVVRGGSFGAGWSVQVEGEARVAERG